MTRPTSRITTGTLAFLAILTTGVALASSLYGRGC